MNRPLVLTGGGLRVALERRGDRFEHAVGVPSETSVRAPRDAPAEPPLLASQPGAADDPWPASPPFASLHCERRGASQIAFLVGLAGDSHWSASVELDERDGRLVFDVACRARSRPRFLGSTYRLLTPPDETGAAGLRWFLPAARLEVDASTGPAELIQETTERFAIVPVISAELEFPATIRWRYVVRASAARIPP